MSGNGKHHHTVQPLSLYLPFFVIFTPRSFPYLCLSTYRFSSVLGFCTLSTLFQPSPSPAFFFLHFLLHHCPPPFFKNINKKAEGSIPRRALEVTSSCICTDSIIIVNLTILKKLKTVYVDRQVDDEWCRSAAMWKPCQHMSNHPYSALCIR